MLVGDVAETYTDLVTTVFSSTIAAKAWLATGAVVLALVQVTTAARIYGRLSFLPERGLGDRARPPLVGPHRVPAHAADLLPLRHDPRVPDARHARRRALARRHVPVRRLRREGARRPRSQPPRMGASDRGAHARVIARRAVADVQPLVLHDGQVRVLMGRAWRPILAGAAVVVVTFVLAQAQVFAPSVPAARRQPAGTSIAARRSSSASAPVVTARAVREVVWDLLWPAPDSTPQR